MVVPVSLIIVKDWKRIYRKNCLRTVSKTLDLKSCSVYRASHDTSFTSKHGPFHLVREKNGWKIQMISHYYKTGRTFIHNTKKNPDASSTKRALAKMPYILTQTLARFSSGLSGHRLMSSVQRDILWVWCICCLLDIKWRSHFCGCALICSDRCIVGWVVLA